MRFGLSRLCCVFGSLIYVAFSQLLVWFRSVARDGLIMCVFIVMDKKMIIGYVNECERSSIVQLHIVWRVRVLVVFYCYSFRLTLSALAFSLVLVHGVPVFFFHYPAAALHLYKISLTGTLPIFNWHSRVSFPVIS